MSQPRTDQHAIAVVERRARAVELRKAGAGYGAIARQLGYKDRSGAYRAVKAALRELVREPAAELVTLELARLDDLLLALWPEARRGNVAKVDRVLKVMARRAALLGLDAPRRFAEVLDPRREAEAIAAEIGKPELVDRIAQDIMLSQEARR